MNSGSFFAPGRNDLLDNNMMIFLLHDLLQGLISGFLLGGFVAHI